MSALATPVAAVLLSSTSDADVIRYSWTEYLTEVEIDGQDMIRTTLAAMDRTAAQAEAADLRETLARIVPGFRSIKLRCVNRTYTERTTWHPDSSEDGDGSPFPTYDVIDGTGVEYDRNARRNLSAEISAAMRGLKLPTR